MQGAQTISTKRGYYPFQPNKFTYESSPKDYVDPIAEWIRLACSQAKETFSGNVTMSTSSDIDVCELPIKGAVNWTEVTLNELDELFEECSEQNWDEYEAVPISHETYSEAIKLVNLLPASYPQPDISPEPDGGIGFEWYKEKGYTFVISVYGKNAISFAGIFGRGNEIHGTEIFNNIVPSFIHESLKRLFD